MASITIRRLQASEKTRLRLRAARHGHSMEEEVREILRRALTEESAPPMNLADAIQALVKPLGGIHLEIPPREVGRDPPKFR